MREIRLCVREISHDKAGTTWRGGATSVAPRAMHLHLFFEAVIQIIFHELPVRLFRHGKRGAADQNIPVLYARNIVEIDDVRPVRP